VVPICFNKCLNCTTFGKLFTKFDFGWGSAPDPAGRAYCAPQTPQLDLRGPTSNGRQGTKDGKEGQRRGRGDGIAGKGRGGEEDFRALPQFQIYH